MNTPERTGALSIALAVVGVIFVVGIYPLTIVWPSGWSWAPGNEHYLEMILGIYATLGVFLIIAARHPLEHLSLIWFTVWSSIVHAAIMAYQAGADPAQHGHFTGDVAALCIVAIVLGALTPRRKHLAG
jgi:Family of unknown function (DUF6632)